MKFTKMLLSLTLLGQSALADRPVTGRLQDDAKRAEWLMYNGSLALTSGGLALYMLGDREHVISQDRLMSGVRLEERELERLRNTDVTLRRIGSPEPVSWYIGSLDEARSFDTVRVTDILAHQNLESVEVKPRISRMSVTGIAMGGVGTLTTIAVGYSQAEPAEAEERSRLGISNVGQAAE